MSSGLFSRFVLYGCLFLQGGRTVTVLSALTINPGYRSGNERAFFRLGFSHDVGLLKACLDSFQGVSVCSVYILYLVM